MTATCATLATAPAAGTHLANPAAHALLADSLATTTALASRMLLVAL